MRLQKWQLWHKSVRAEAVLLYEWEIRQIGPEALSVWLYRISMYHFNCVAVVHIHFFSILVKPLRMYEPAFW